MTAAGHDLRARMRADLTLAMRERRKDAVSALRTTLAAIDNAEAVVVDHALSSESGEHVAGARAGVASTEAERRTLSSDEVGAIVRAAVDERAAEADTYDAHGRPDAAEHLRAEAATLERYLTA